MNLQHSPRQLSQGILGRAGWLGRRQGWPELRRRRRSWRWAWCIYPVFRKKLLTWLKELCWEAGFFLPKLPQSGPHWLKTAHIGPNSPRYSGWPKVVQKSRLLTYSLKVCWQLFFWQSVDFDMFACSSRQYDCRLKFSGPWKPKTRIGGEKNEKARPGIRKCSFSCLSLKLGEEGNQPVYREGWEKARQDWELEVGVVWLLAILWKIGATSF